MKRSYTRGYTLGKGNNIDITVEKSWATPYLFIYVRSQIIFQLLNWDFLKFFERFFFGYWLLFKKKI